MDAELRNILSKLVLGIRHLLEGYYDDGGVWHAGDLEQRLNQVGVWRDRPAKPLDELPQLSEADNKARRTVDAYIKYREETGVDRVEAVVEFIRESAYTWFNRLFALRCMEARGIIDEIIHQKAIYGGRSLQHNRLTIHHPQLCAGEDDGLYAVLFQEFERRAHELPLLFNPASPAVVLRPSVSVVKKLVSMLSGREPVNGDYAFDDAFIAPDTFGWAYQYWNAEEKDRVFERVRIQKVKISGKDIVPVTCLYTESYMVKFLVQNSLGAQWCCMHPEYQLYGNWEYYVRDADRSQIDLKPVREITFFDPACGSGHFLLEAFDLYYQMYREEGILSESEEICASILENNLYGVDIDERAIQISIAVLWMKAKEWAPELDTSGLSRFHDHLVATNVRLPRGRDHLKEFLRKHPEDLPLGSALESIFEAMENVHEIGSLLKIEEPLQKTFENMMSDAGIQTTLWSNGFTSMASWRENVIDQLKEHFNEEAISSDLTQAFWGKNVNKGFQILETLSKKYDIVATNPPYMGSGNMNKKLKIYISNNYNAGKRDLYSAFIIRCKEFLKHNGIVGMITQQSWLYLKAFSDLRFNKKMSSNGLLKETCLNLIVVLGTKSFSEISGEVVNTVLFTLINKIPTINSKTKVFHLISYDDLYQKINNLKKCCKEIEDNELIYINNQFNYLRIQDSPIAYNLTDKLYDLIEKNNIGKNAKVITGLQTSDDRRFIRYYWEVNSKKIVNDRNRHWVTFEKGGGYGRWFGHHYWVIDWEYNGARLKSFPKSYIRNEQHYFKEGYTYSYVGSSSVGLRKRIGNDIFAHVSSSIIPKIKISGFASLVNSRISTYTIRAINKNLGFNESYISKIPIINLNTNIDKYETLCIDIMKKISSFNINERTYDVQRFSTFNNQKLNKINIDLIFLNMLLHTIEGYIEKIIFTEYNLDDDEKQILNETGIPCGWYPIIQGYDKIKNIQKYNDINEIMQKYDFKKITINNNELDILKNQIRKIYTNDTNNSQSFSWFNKNKYPTGRLPLPYETKLEEYCHMLKLHPISVFNLLIEGIREEGWENIEIEKGLILNVITIHILKLMGHQWPEYIVENTIEPTLIDSDGIILITKISQDSSLFERIKILIENDGNDINKFLNRFEKIFQKSLENWLIHDFFKDHIKQFKNRPILWEITSNFVTNKGKYKDEPAFSCMIYSQKVNRDTLSKVLSQYVNPLENSYLAEYYTLEKIGILTVTQSARMIKLEKLIDEISSFKNALIKVIENGFFFNGLKNVLESESLDKWTSIDINIPPPKNLSDFLIQEKYYSPHTDNGVRVNIAPLQNANLLACDVLIKKDVDRAISDRVKWRSDERRWCREGKLPQPGWWNKEEVD
ncbi:putative N6-adenine-specific DNA methylase [Thaumarchaeota archaeon SCGC AB-539-E09]|nr:putative N6-adenine-specific DNA methylase [Thaumarchaeota archaeon SCGC AB-539-E09]